MADSNESDQEVQSGKVSRRAVLGGAGSSLLAMSGMAVAGAVPDDADMVEIPKAVHGEEVVETKKVPKKWWGHVKKVRRLNKKLDKAPGISGRVARTDAKNEIAGKNRLKLQIEHRPDGPQKSNHHAARNEKVEGVPVEKTTRPKPEPVCQHIQPDDPYYGGQNCGGVNAQGGPANVGTVACLGETDDGGEYLVTAHHVIRGGDGTPPCNHPEGDDIHIGFTQSSGEIGGTVAPNDYSALPAVDVGFVDIAGNPNDLQGKVWNGSSGLEDMVGQVTNYEDDMADGVEFVKQGVPTGKETGQISNLGSDVEPIEGITPGDDVCRDYYDGSGVEFEMRTAGGDSGGPVYRIDQRINDQVARLATVSSAARDPTSYTSCWYNDQIPEYNFVQGATASIIKSAALLSLNEGTLYFGGK